MPDYIVHNSPLTLGQAQPIELEQLQLQRKQAHNDILAVGRRDGFDTQVYGYIFAGRHAVAFVYMAALRIRNIGRDIASHGYRR